MRTISLIACYLFLISLITACHSHYYQKSHALPTNQWDQGYSVEFRVDVDDYSHAYDIHVDLAYRAREVPADLQLQMKVESPSGAMTSYLYTIPLKNENGEQLGDIAGDYGEIRFTIEEKFEFKEIGSFLLKFEQDESTRTVEGINSVGLTIDQHK